MVFHYSRGMRHLVARDLRACFAQEGRPGLEGSDQFACLARWMGGPLSFSKERAE